MSTKSLNLADLEAVVYKLQRERNVALEQRDALLAALRAFVRAYDAKWEHPEWEAPHIVAARAAIEAATKE